MLVPDPAVPGGSRVKLLDFGIAKLARNEGRGTATHDVFGTPQYMSPEQCAGAGGVDAKTDVYALGVILFEMLAGRLPFLAETPLEYMGQHAFKPPPPLADLAPHAPAELVALVQRMLVKDRQTRPAMRQVAEELARLQAAVSGASGTLAADALSAPVTSPAADGLNEGKGALSPRAAGPPSTLGNSLGQPLRRKQKTRQVLLISSLVAVVGLVALGLNLGRHTSAPGPLPASPDLAPPSLQPAVAEPKPAAPVSDTPSPPTRPVVSATAEASKLPKPKANKPAAASRPVTKPKPSAAATPAKPPVAAAPPPPETRPVRRED